MISTTTVYSSSNALINGRPGLIHHDGDSIGTTSRYDRQSATSAYSDGEASLPVRMELANGAVVTSLLGYTLAYNTLDNNKSPTSGLYASITQDFAGVGGDVNFIRSTADSRTYYELLPDIVGVLHLQGGHLAGWGGRICACWITSRWARTSCAASRRPASVRAT